MRSNKTKRIGTNGYEVTQLGAVEGRRVFARLTQLMGGMVGTIAGGGKADLAKGFESFAAAISPDVMDYFCDTFTKVTQVHRPDGKTLFLKDIFDDHFADNYSEMVEWLVFCLEVNFASFLGGAGGLGALLRAKDTSGSLSPQGLTGLSGESSPPQS